MFAKRSLFILLYLAGLWGSVFLLSDVSFISIKNIEIFGAETTPIEEIKNVVQEAINGRYFYTVSRSNSFFYPKREINSQISKTFPRIDELHVGLKSLQILEVNVVERNVYAVWCDLDLATIGGEDLEKCFQMDESGYIFELFSHEQGQTFSDLKKYIKFYSRIDAEKPIGQRYMTEERFKGLTKFIDDLASAGFEVVLVKENKDENLEVVLKGGQRLILNKDDNFSQAFENFRTIISDDIIGRAKGFSRVDYLDLRFGNKLFYKFK